MPAAGATAREGVLISLRLAVRSIEKNEAASVTGFHHAPKKQYRGGRLAPDRMFLDPNKNKTGNAPRTPGNTSGSCLHGHDARQGTGENWELGRYPNQRKLLRRMPGSSFVVRNNRHSRT